MKNKKIYLAPMAGISDRAFRRICQNFDVDGVVTEMVSAKGLYYEDEKTKILMDTSSDIKPVSIQIFGSEPEIMATVTKKYLNELKFDYLDINMGCPVPKVTKNNEGSALMKNPKLAYDIVYAIKKVSNKPVSVKFRKGYDNSNINAVEFAKVLEQAGADRICVHGRTKQQLYSGEADWEIIAKVKQNVNIEVFANGDVTTPEKAKEILELTNCDGVMIARGAQGKPWLFRQIKQYLNTGIYSSEPSLKERIDIIEMQYNEMLKYVNEYVAVREMRKHILYYLKGIENGSKMRGEINLLNSYTDVINRLREYC